MTYLRTCLAAVRSREAARAAFGRDPFAVPHVVIGTPTADLLNAIERDTAQIRAFAAELQSMVAAPLVPVALPLSRPEARIPGDAA